MSATISVQSEFDKINIIVPEKTLLRLFLNAEYSDKKDCEALFHILVDYHIHQVEPGWDLKEKLILLASRFTTFDDVAYIIKNDYNDNTKMDSLKNMLYESKCDRKFYESFLEDQIKSTCNKKPALHQNSGYKGGPVPR